jgi:hypothetical protein
MKIPVETTPALWGVVGGAIALAVIGFSWGGWVTGGKAEEMAKQRSDLAVVTALAPICVGNFKEAKEASANLVALRKAESWSQGEFVEKGGWAMTPGAVPGIQVTAVARACAVLLVAG